MLKIEKSISLTGYCVINEGGVNVNVVYLNASVSTDGSSTGSTTKSVLNQDLYFRHRRDIRKDMSDFDDAVFAVEDELAAEEMKNKESDKENLSPSTSTPIITGMQTTPIMVEGTENKEIIEKKES